MLKTALVYDWLVTIGGGEKTLAAIFEEFPSPIHTLVKNDKSIAQTVFSSAEIHSSFLQKIPFSSSCYRYFLPLFPLAIEQFDLSEYDVILSTSHAVAKGVLTHPRQLHLCYCLTPMRYAWDLTHRYLESVNPLQKVMARIFLHYLRNWDIASLNRVDHFASISHYVARRIKKIYGRESDVIYPPVDVEEIPYQENKEDFYLAVSRMVPYKKIDLIAEAFTKMPDKKLVIIGDGPQMSNVKRKSGKNVEILGHQSDSKVRDYMKKTRGFIFAAEEDFGIVVLEAQAAGTPVLAFGRGAALETVQENETGLFFQEQSVSSLIHAFKQFESRSFDPKCARANAMKYNKARFQKEFRDFVLSKAEHFYEGHHTRRR
jgi:glycosyltransferase involved in cell wall biosynthesis